MNKVIVLLINLYLASLSAYSQTTNEISIAQLADNIRVYNEQALQQQVYLHLDKPHYLPGEYILFSAYVLDYTTNLPLPWSKSLYIKVENENGNCYAFAKIKLENGLGSGAIKLPKAMKSGNYLVKAHTNWMLNHDESFRYSKKIRVGVKPDLLDKPKEPQKIEIFAEGGSIVQNKLNNILLLGNSGILNGYIEDAFGKKQEIEIDSTGTSTFQLIPTSKEGYFLHIIDRKDTLKYPIENIKDNGTVLSCKLEENEFQIKVQSSSNLQNETGLLIVTHRSEVLFSANADLSDGGFITRIPFKSLPAGIINILLYNNEGVLLNSRIYNIMRTNGAKLAIRGNDTYKTRENVQIQLDLLEAEMASASVSIRKIDYYGNNSDNINDRLKTTGTSIRISDINSNRLNDLLIARKDNAVNWEKIKDTLSLNIWHPMERGYLIQIKGRLVLEEKSFIGPQTLVITVLGEDKNLYFKATDRNGNFELVLPPYYNEKTVIIKVHGISEGDNSPQIEIDNICEEVSLSEIYSEVNLSENPSSFVATKKENALIREKFGLNYYVPESANFKDTKDIFNVFTTPDKTYNLNDYIRLDNMYEVAIEILQGVRIVEKKEGYEVRLKSVDSRTGRFVKFYDENPLMFIDGVPVYDANIIGKLDPDIVATIDVKYGQYKIGNVEFKGILSINTVEGNYGQLNDLNHIILSKKGFAYPVELKVPEINSRTPDFRPLLFWEDNFEITNKGNNTIQFKTSDDIGDYIVDVQGVTNKGALVSKQFVFKVEASQPQ